MARVYPSAGSAYSYISGEFRAYRRFLCRLERAAGLPLNPWFAIWCSSAAANFVPMVPPVLWKVFFATLFTGMLNLRGVERRRTNQWLAIFMGRCGGVAACLHRALPVASGTAGRRIPGLLRSGDLPASARLHRGLYRGADVHRLRQHLHLPRKRSTRTATSCAPPFSCLFTGVLAAVECHAGQLVWPDFSRYPDVDTAYVFIAGRAGGKHLFTLLNATLLLATVGSGTGAMMGCARLLYGMGTGGALPRAFCYVEPRRGVPSRNVLFCGALALVGAWAISYQLGCELLNFGAFLAFLGVNAAAFHYYYVRGRDRRLGQALVPLIGAAVCLYIWWSLRWQAKLAGFVWVLVGAAYFEARRRTSRATL
jgi:amino acid transporter